MTELSAEQKDIIGCWGKGLAVLAGAGCGKTTTLVLKCEELLRRDPEARFAAVSFTERSAGDLRAKLSKSLGNLAGKHWVMTIHGLCGSVLREYPREAGFDGEERMLSQPETELLWEQAMDSLWSDDLPVAIQAAFDRLIGRESRDSLRKLLRRVRALRPFGVLERLEAGAGPAPSTSGDARALITVSSYLMDRFERLKQRRGGLDFDDLERGADRALEHEHVRDAYRKRFNLFLVDEFQDTNPVQARIISRLARGDLSNLCVVGDPKQSIYRFRDADVSVFEEFCSRMPAQMKLSMNFRSRPPIIELVNRVCAPAFEASEMSYGALVAGREAAASGPESGDAPEVGRLDVETPEELGAWIGSEIARGEKIEDHVLLLRKIRGNERWLKALTAAGIPIAVGSGGFFWEDPRVREMTAFLKWWFSPANRFSGAVFLRAPWMGISDEQLDGWIRTGEDFRVSFLASGHPVALRLRPWADRVARPAEVLAELLIDDAAEAELGSAFLGLWHRCEELSSRGLSAGAVVAELALAVEQERRETEVAPPRNRGQLRVLTLHGSKGLEFPVVILLDFAGKSRAAEAPLLFWDRERGAYLGARDSDGERNKKDPVEASWRELEKAKDLAESKRVFYVALTRARERLVLVMPKLEKPAPDAAEVLAQDNWRGWIDAHGGEIARLETGTQAVSPERAPERAKETQSARGATKRAPAVTLIRPRHSVTEWNVLLRCERAYEWTYIRPAPASAESPDLGAGNGFEVREEGISQRDLGTRVHACLENSDFAGLEKLEREAGSGRFRAAPVIAWASQSGQGSEWMRGPDAALAAGSERHVRSELAFEIPAGPGGLAVLVGSMDRVVLSGLGGAESRASIIDFKVTREPKPAEALLESYRNQMELYAAALEVLHGGRLPTECVLVNIAGSSVTAVPVALRGIDVAAIAAQAGEIVNGRAGAPSPGPRCRYCPHRARCPEGRGA